MAKVPHGGWFALAVAGAVFAFSFVWWWGSNTKNNTLIATQVTNLRCANESPDTMHSCGHCQKHASCGVTTCVGVNGTTRCACLAEHATCCTRVCVVAIGKQQHADHNGYQLSDI